MPTLHAGFSERPRLFQRITQHLGGVQGVFVSLIFNLMASLVVG